LHYRLTEIAADDIVDILKESRRQFGPVQRDRYARLIAKAAEMIGDNPERVGSRKRDDLLDGLRSFHVELAAGRLGAASHVLYYLRDDGGDGVIILRVLHRRMDSVMHIGTDLG
jgi:toxin ParE1/3/4